MKKALNIVFYVVGALVILLLAGVVAMQFPSVQTFAGKKALENISKDMRGRMTFSSVSVEPFKAIVVKDFVILDDKPFVQQDGDFPGNGPDTLLHVGQLSAKFSLAGLMDGKGLHLSRLSIDGGSFNLSVEPYLGTEYDRAVITNLERIFDIESPSNPVFDWGNIAYASNLSVKDFKYRMKIYDGQFPGAAPGVISWNDLDLTTSIRARGVRVADGLVCANVEHLDIHEKSGATFHNLTGRVRVGKEKVIVNNLVIDEEFSYLNLRTFKMLGPLKDYNEIFDKIRFEGDFRSPSHLSIKTISRFAPGMDNLTMDAKIVGKVAGYVSDFVFDDFRFEDLTSGLTATLRGDFIGLPYIEDSHFNINVTNLRFETKTLEKFVTEWAPKTKIGLGGIAKGVGFTFNGSAKGPLNRLRIAGNVKSSAGKAQADVTIRNLMDSARPVIIGGTASTENIDVGKIVGTDIVHEVTMRTGLEASFGNNGINVRIDSLKVPRLNALGYDYSGIEAVGTFTGSDFDGRIICNDPNLRFLFQGLFNLSPRTRNASYEFFANLGYADLNALHLDPRSPSKVSLMTEASFVRTENKDLLGEVNIRNLRFESATGSHDIGNITVNSTVVENGRKYDFSHKAKFSSRFANGSFAGSKSILAMVSDLKTLLLSRELPALLEDPDPTWEKARYNLDFKFSNATEVLSFIAPGVYIDDGTAIRMRVDTSGIVNGSVSSGRLAIKDKYMKDLFLSMDNRGGSINASARASSLKVGAMVLRDGTLMVTADNNSIDASAAFDNGLENETSADLRLLANISRGTKGLGVNGRVLPSSICYNGQCWSLSSGTVEYYGGDAGVDNLIASCDSQSVLVDGGISSSRTDTLRVDLANFDISLLNTILGSGTIPSLGGRANGKALVLSPTAPTPGLLADIICHGTTISGFDAGDIAAGSQWNGAGERFDLYVRNDIDGLRTIDVTGFLKPSNGDIGATAKLEGLEMGYASEYLTDIFSRFSGSVYGTVTLGGNLKSPRLDSDGLNLRDGILEVDFTKVRYFAEGPVSVNNDGLHFEGIKVKDGLGGTGEGTGGIYFGNFKDFRTGIHIDFRDMKAIAMQPGDNNILYGDAFATGTVDVTGPFDAILLSVSGRTTKSGNVHIPLDNSLTASTHNLLTFTEPPKEEQYIDRYEQMMGLESTGKQRAARFDIALNIQATPDVMAYLDIGQGNTLSGTGAGTIAIDVSEVDDLFTINGDYTLQDGSFHVSAMDLISRDFSIRDGSSIRFEGDVMDSDLDINAVYTTKTSLANLISDSTSVSRRNVECGIAITDKLRNPQIALSIEVPDLDPATQSLVESALNTEDKVQKQFLYLLITNTFLPSEESGITAGLGSDMLFSNVSGIMSGQLNNIFQKLDIPLDLGLNYQPSESGSDIFDVAVSTQLFNNRVVVNGTLGNKRYGSTTTDEVAGDLDVEIKMDQSGAVRLNMFSHSADQYTNYLDDSQRNGGGITFQKEFNTFGDLLRDIFSSKKKREKRRLEALENETSVTLQIDTAGVASKIETK